MRPSAAEHPGAARLDRWLVAVRLFPSRALASRAVSGGRVHLNGVRRRSAHPVRAGDVVSFTRGALQFECHVLSVPERRGAAPLAQRCYAETPQSAARRAEFSARPRTQPARSPRPQKHERRALRRLRGRI